MDLELGLGVAPLSLLPKLHPEVVVRKLESSDEPYVVVKDRRTRKYYKFEVWEGDLLPLMDGTRDWDALAAAFNALHPELGVDPQFMADYVEEMKKLDLVERPEQERHLIMMDKLKTLRKRRFYDAESSTLVQIHMPLFDPDRFMSRVMPWIRWWWSPWFVIAWVIVFIGVLGFLVANWDLYWAGFWDLLDPRRKTIWDWSFLFALIGGVSIWHELGHGFTCKRFGGEVHDIGFMLFYLQPAFYCKVDDSYMFPSVYHRMYSAFGGAYFELMLLSFAMSIWLLTPAEWWIHSVALAIVFFTGLSAILININPLIKLDGYYALMDWLDVPELREDSFRYIGGLVKKHLLGLQVPSKPISRRRRRIYLVFGILAMTYTALMLTLFYRLLNRWFLGWFGPIGLPLLLLLVAYLMRRKLRDLGRFARHLWLDKRERIATPRGLTVVGIGLLALLILLAVPRWPTRIEAGFTVEPQERVVVRAPVEGVIRRVEVTEGAKVRPGQLLAVLENPDLVAARAVAAADRERATWEAAAARSLGDIASERQKTAQARSAVARLDYLDATLASLRLEAPIPAVVTTPDLEEVLGRHLRMGDVFCTLDRLENVKLDISASERDVEEIMPGMAVRILPTAYAGRTLRTLVLTIAPSAEPARRQAERALDLIHKANRIRTYVEVANPGGSLRPGMTGRIQFLGEPRTVLGGAWWRLKRWALLLLW